MPGRQAHGRSLTSAPKSKATKKSKARSQKNALNAFGIAQDHFDVAPKKTPRFRQLETEAERKKHPRNDDDDEDEDDFGDGDEEEEMPQRKRMKRPTAAAADDNAEYGSDSEGNEWRLGGMAEDDEDSEIESDDAFGESDEEKFSGYTFRGSKSSKPKRQEESDNSEDDENDDEGETLGEDAIDLATALDQWEEDSEQDEKQKKKKPKAGDSDSSASEESDADDDEEEDSEEADDDDDDDDDDDGDEADPEKLNALRGLVSGFGGDEEDDGKAKGSAKQKISIGDLGLGNLQDPFMKSSLKLMNKESKEKRPGATKKLDVPLARRQQDRIDRSAAYDKTNETLDRWTDTVKHNRRADHLVFPLPETTGFAGLDNTEIQPLASSNAHNELESAVLSIMDQSGLSMEKAPKPKEKVYDEDGNELTKKEIANRKRLERELQSREAKRAARIKKIKSKAYHRVHRKQRERDDVATREAMAEAGEIDSDEEREAQDRRRALERVGLRHKESKWAKMGSKAKRAVWDDDFRAGLTDMARQDEELRRRKEGRRTGSDDDTSSSDDDSDDGDASLRRQLAQLEEDDDTEPQSGLMSMKFMQKAEAARKKENDELIQQIRRELDGGDDGEADEDDEAEEVGRRQYGGAPGAVSTTALDTSKRKAKKNRDNDDDGDDVVITLDGSAPKSGKTRSGDLPASESTAKSTEGAWSRGETRRKKKGTMGARIDELDLNANVMVAARPQQKKSGKNAASAKPNNGEDDSGDDDDDAADQHLPLAIRDQELVARAFAGEDVVGEFEREKAEVEEADDDKVIDNTLPGWGSWVGDGVSNKEKKRHQGRFLTKVKGVNKKDRKDAKLDKVIINEKRVKKNDRYLASQLPHPFESRQQYEHSLRMPVGPEWQTKVTFQDSTKPRVIMKQGIIAPISKPIV